jgi:mRNA-degrading endonuclease toxin of MazEF toxin-antitoxin module
MRAIWTSSDEAVVLADQIKSVDGRSRRAIGKGAVSPEELADVRAKLLTLVG